MAEEQPSQGEQLAPDVHLSLWEKIVGLFAWLGTFIFPWRS
jgi:hypothetical protein